jgi:hypothetical protein
VTTPPATSGSSTPDRSVVNPQQPPGPVQGATQLAGRTHDHLGPPTSLVLALMLMAVVGWFLAAGEWICLDRSAVWGPPENPGVYTDCPGT